MKTKERRLTDVWQVSLKWNQPAPHEGRLLVFVTLWIIRNGQGGQRQVLRHSVELLQERKKKRKKKKKRKRKRKRSSRSSS